MIDELNLNGVNVEYNEFHIDFSKPLSEQIWELNEDLLQFSIGENYIVDVGYYPSNELNGRFKIVSIKDYDWENPVIIRNCSDYQSLVADIQAVINKTKELIKQT